MIMLNDKQSTISTKTSRVPDRDCQPELPQFLLVRRVLGLQHGLETRLAKRLELLVGQLNLALDARHGDDRSVSALSTTQRSHKTKQKHTHASRWRRWPLSRAPRSDECQSAMA